MCLCTQMAMKSFTVEWKKNQPQTPSLLASIPQHSCLLCYQWACIKCSDVSLIPLPISLSSESSIISFLLTLRNLSFLPWTTFTSEKALLKALERVVLNALPSSCSHSRLLAQGCIYLALVAQSNSKHTPLTLWEHVLTDIHSCVWTHER